MVKGQRKPVKFLDDLAGNVALGLICQFRWPGPQEYRLHLLYLHELSASCRSVHPGCEDSMPTSIRRQKGPGYLQILDVIKDQHPLFVDAEAAQDGPDKDILVLLIKLETRVASARTRHTADNAVPER